MGWRLKIQFSDGTEELVNEIFDSEEDAEYEYDSWLESFPEGQETLELRGEDNGARIVDYDIWEED